MEITKMSDPSDSLRQHSAVGLVYTKLQVKFYHMCSACDLAIHPACSKNLLDQSGTLSSIKVYEYPSPYTLVCPIAEHVHLLLLRQKIPQLHFVRAIGCCKKCHFQLILSFLYDIFLLWNNKKIGAIIFWTGKYKEQYKKDILLDFWICDAKTRLFFKLFCKDQKGENMNNQGKNQNLVTWIA